ncbi:cupin domain-containing protein [Pseudomonas koreensis]|uniref:cupin domain-containing protein n=1 Tax=Pseudomonas koreensis TaxID=198620 RepID=UPI0014738C62|nr:cupin domain-containing protein [Pseudomonas koreensis]NNA54532.1 cupin domain-containing protein [Pseudomonas koreensis]
MDLKRMEADSTYFKSWRTYHGLLCEAHERNVLTNEPMITRLYGFETVSDPTADRGIVPAGGATFGFVMQGTVELRLPGTTTLYGSLSEGQWFSLPDGVSLRLGADSRAMVAQSLAFKGLAALGGPIETVGRLRYIDRCSDTLLMCPPLLGDPCLNHLHFPTDISQTEHTHPSGRFGAVARGKGICETPSGKSELLAGNIFYIPDGARHRFCTEDNHMDVIAYHPDSDWGPTDREHPMINRTWVNGSKMDNSTAEHQSASVIARQLDSLGDQ